MMRKQWGGVVISGLLATLLCLPVAAAEPAKAAAPGAKVAEDAVKKPADAKPAEKADAKTPEKAVEKTAEKPADKAASEKPAEPPKPEPSVVQRVADEKAAARERAAEAARQKAEDQKRLQQERERSCVVRPVMTDTEIANCKDVWAEKPAIDPAKVSVKVKKKVRRGVATEASGTAEAP